MFSVHGLKGVTTRYKSYKGFERDTGGCKESRGIQRVIRRLQCKGLQRFARGYSKPQGVTTVLPKTSVHTNLGPPLHVSRGHISHFKHPCVLAVNRMANLTFREKKTTKPSFPFFQLNFNVYINVHNRERARGRDKKQRPGHEFRCKKIMKIYSGGEEMRIASNHQGKN